MLALRLLLVTLTASIVAVNAFGGSEEKFIKKYAMMKIYESCFGPEVVKQIRKEMRAACMKCAVGAETTAPPAPTLSPRPRPLHPGQQHHAGDEKDSIDIASADNSLFQHPHQQPQQQQPLDVEKLHQAILAYRPGPFGNAGPAAGALRPFLAGGMGGMGGGQQGFYGGGAGMGAYPGQNPFMQYNPAAAAYQQAGLYPSPYGHFPYFGAQPYYTSGQRMSRDMDIRGQLEAITSRMSGRVKNVTCVMQELGYLDDNLEPNYAKISERIGNLPVPDELRRDMQDGVTFCQQFSQCVPETKKEKSPLSRELIRPMFFFKCYKHKKLEACIMKDVREKYSGVTEDDFDTGDVELRRTGKSTKIPDTDIDALASSMYEFLYGHESLELDSIL